MCCLSHDLVVRPEFPDQHPMMNIPVGVQAIHSHVDGVAQFQNLKKNNTLILIFSIRKCYLLDNSTNDI